MRIAIITAGAAGMYCGACLHDNTLAAALQKMGHDVALVPLYTPIRTDEEDVSIHRVFYGAISIYLEQKSSMFRRLPRAIGRLLSRPWLLKKVVRAGASTDPHDLGALTLSVLQGEDGRQRQELERLVGWLRDSYRPDVVHLSHSLFLGMARRIKKELNVPLVCSVQGEDLFLDNLEPLYHAQVLDVLRRRARDADAFLAPCDDYAGLMREFLDVPAEKMRVVRLGVKLDGYEEAPALEPRPFTVGYLARIAPEKGLQLLAEAFHHLAQRVGPEKVRLRAAGWLSPAERSYLDGIHERMRSWGLTESFEYVGEVDRAGKIAFLRSVDVLSVPTAYRDPKGIFVLEALAAGVPVVQPRHGTFPELVEATGGGLLFEPGSAEALAEALADLMEKPEKRRGLGRQGREIVHRSLTDRAMAEATLKVYGAACDAVAAA